MVLFLSKKEITKIMPKKVNHEVWGCKPEVPRQTINVLKNGPAGHSDICSLGPVDDGRPSPTPLNFKHID